MANILFFHLDVIQKLNEILIPPTIEVMFIGRK